MNKNQEAFATRSYVRFLIKKRCASTVVEGNNFNLSNIKLQNWPHLASVVLFLKRMKIAIGCCCET